MKLKFGYNEAVIGPAIGSAHGSGYPHVKPVCLPCNDVVKQMPMSGAGVHPGSLFPSRKTE